jgi:hypothetical protein
MAFYLETEHRPSEWTYGYHTWAADEDSKLKDAVKTHGGKDWTAIAALVSGRAGNQCKHRWKGVLDPIGRANRRTGKWTAVEDRKLKDALQTNWAAISALVPGRTRNQCNHRWRRVLNANITPTAGRKGKWEEDEGSKLKVAIEMHGDKDWVAVSALVPGSNEKSVNSQMVLCLASQHRPYGWTYG